MIRFSKRQRFGFNDRMLMPALDNIDWNKLKGYLEPEQDCKPLYMERSWVLYANNLKKGLTIWRSHKEFSVYDEHCNLLFRTFLGKFEIFFDELRGKLCHPTFLVSHPSLSLGRMHINRELCKCPDCTWVPRKRPAFEFTDDLSDRYDSLQVVLNSCAGAIEKLAEPSFDTDLSLKLKYPHVINKFYPMLDDATVAANSAAAAAAAAADAADAATAFAAFAADFAAIAAAIASGTYAGFDFDPATKVVCSRRWYPFCSLLVWKN